MKPLMLYLLLINAVSLLLMHIDKRRAIKNLWRIPGSTLLLTAVLGGSIGCMLGMKLCRHKTLHPKFFIGVPLIITLQVLIAVFLLIKL